MESEHPTEKENETMTIQSKATIQTLLKNKGVFPDEGMGAQKASRVYQYESALGGNTQFAVFMRSEDDDMALSPYIGGFQLLLEEGELTPEGEAFLSK